MLRCRHRPIVSLITALVVAVSLVGQGMLATAASAKMMASASGIEVSSADDPMDCAGHDQATRVACVATCAGILAIVADAVVLPLVPLQDRPAERRSESLSDRNIPPDPHPPRPSALS
jgi:hypothetical protein